MSRTLKAALNESNPNKVAPVLNALAAGAALAAIPQFYKGAVVDDVLELPEELRAATILKCYSTAGTLTDELTPVPQGTTPASGEVGVSPTGNVLFAAADAVSAAEVMYLPFQGEVYEDLITVDTSVGTLLASRGAVLLLEAEVISGVLAGDLDVLDRGTATTSGGASINDAGTGITFHSDDVIDGTARVKYVAAPGVGKGPRKSLATLLTELQAAL